MSTTEQPVTKVIFDQPYLLVNAEPKLTAEITAWEFDKSLTIRSDIEGDHNIIVIPHENVIKLKKLLNQLY